MIKIAYIISIIYVYFYIGQKLYNIILNIFKKHPYYNVAKYYSFLTKKQKTWIYAIIISGWFPLIISYAFYRLLKYIATYY